MSRGLHRSEEWLSERLKSKEFKKAVKLHEDVNADIARAKTEPTPQAQPIPSPDQPFMVAKVSAATGKVGTFRKASKYKNVKTEVDGVKFDSKKEAKRWQELKLLEGIEITNLRRQVRYTLIPSQERADGTKERAVEYVADFVYDSLKAPHFDIVEDAKGMRTADYIIKRKLLLFIHGITIIEV